MAAETHRPGAPGTWWILAVALYAAEVLVLGTFALPLGMMAGFFVLDCSVQGRVYECSSPWQMPVSVLPMIALLATVAITANSILARRGRVRPIVVAAIATPAVQAAIVLAVIGAVHLEEIR
ncbi:hypothetical protein G6027_12160 [Dietzia sp. SLG310A2-38A2]|uniref:hypothetical protein n=1 Tax=Dietzia sp. SLG310A2-38A2 TaxID=1630643 RepID=UPI0015FB874B|nr:hypothetical protein [Dietzia sp. SLG310A2-38A2]MBB1031629.1 hypothetical protein [Dietzia sp. SLG310A2-38A2]